MAQVLAFLSVIFGWRNILASEVSNPEPPAKSSSDSGASWDPIGGNRG